MGIQKSITVNFKDSSTSVCPLRLDIHRRPLWSNGLNEFKQVTRQISKQLFHWICLHFFLFPLNWLNQLWWQKLLQSYFFFTVSNPQLDLLYHIETKWKSNWFCGSEGWQNYIRGILRVIMSQSTYFYRWGRWIQVELRWPPDLDGPGLSQPRNPGFQIQLFLYHSMFLL